MRKRFTGLLLALVLLLAPQAALGWGDTGHMVVAQIAHSRLNPTAAARVEELVELVSANYRFTDKRTGRMMSVSKTYTPITIANYMDDMRDDKRSEFLKAWHFTNVPFFDGIPESDIELPRVNIETQLEESIEILRANAFSTDPKKRFKEAINLAYLFHLIGDLHQPLHCVSRYSTEHPRGLGDIGGNSFFLDRVPPGQKNKEKLHGYWDAGGRQFTFVSRPLSSEGFNTIRNFAFQSMREYPDRNPDWKETAVSVWINESRELAVANAYKDTANRPLKQFVEPDDDYRNRAQKIARRRVAMAGYRLAALLNSIYPNR